MWAMWFNGLLVVRIYSKCFIIIYIVFLFVKTENNNFIKEIKYAVRASIACWKPQQSLWEFSSRWKPLTASQVFVDLLSNSPKRSPQFSPGYEGMENMFYFLSDKQFDTKTKQSVSCTLSRNFLARNSNHYDHTLHRAKALIIPALCYSVHTAFALSALSHLSIPM